MAVCCSNDLWRVAGTLLLCLEQPNILDGDYCLISEGRDQFDLLFGEWSNHGAGHHQNADRHSLTQQRDAEHRAGDAKWGPRRIVFGV